MSAKTNVFACQLWKLDVIRWNKTLLFTIVFCVHIWQKNCKYWVCFPTPRHPRKNKVWQIFDLGAGDMKTILKLRFCWHAGTQQRHPHEILWHSRCWDKPPDKQQDSGLSGQILSPFTYKNCKACRACHQFSFLYGFHACPVDQYIPSLSWPCLQDPELYGAYHMPHSDGLAVATTGILSHSGMRNRSLADKEPH